MAKNKVETMARTKQKALELSSGKSISEWLEEDNNFEKFTETVKSAEEFATELTGRFKVEIGEPPRSVFGR